MSKKLYAVVLDKNMIVSDLIGGGIAVYENIKTAKIRLEQIYHTVKRNALKLGAKHVFKRRYSIKEYILNEPKPQDTKWQKLKREVLNYCPPNSLSSLEYANGYHDAMKKIYSIMQELEEGE